MRPRSSSVSRLAAIVALSGVLAACGGPPLVEDDAALLAPEQVERIGTFHAFLRKDHGIDYRVVTVRDAGDINLYAAQRYADLDIGAGTKAGRGLLLVIDSGRNLVRLEVGGALEGVFPDAFVAYVEHRQMVPFFRAGRIADGILATTELIVTRAERAKLRAGSVGEVWYQGSAGAGATAPGRIGEGPDPAFAAGPRGGPGGATPGETLAKYLQAMRQRNANPDLAIYTPATRRMLRQWVMTPAQMDNVIKTYRRCGPASDRIGPDGRRAVIRYAIAERHCAPWFFLRVDGVWALDLVAMQRIVRFGRDNSCHFDPSQENPYAFAFTDWRIDRRGYPRAR